MSKLSKKILSCINSDSAVKERNQGIKDRSNKYLKQQERMSQLSIPGIGQQKAKLSDWKKENNIFTLKSPCEDIANPWCCWDEIEDFCDFMSKHGDAFGYGETEKEAIISFCDDNEIKLPFWW